MGLVMHSQPIFMIIHFYFFVLILHIIYYACHLSHSNTDALVSTVIYNTVVGMHSNLHLPLLYRYEVLSILSLSSLGMVNHCEESLT